MGLCKTVRITFSNRENMDALRNRKERCIIAFWHGSMLLGWFLHRPQGKEKISSLVSQSKDGTYLSLVLEKWNYILIRGSSHIGGKEAMQLMADAVNNGESIAITPDGPTGPYHIMKMGAVRLAQKTNVPLFLCGIALKKKKQLRSWDMFEIPMPFSKAAVVYSNPIFVPQDLHGEPLDIFLSATEKQFQELGNAAEKIL